MTIKLRRRVLILDSICSHYEIPLLSVYACRQRTVPFLASNPGRVHMQLLPLPCLALPWPLKQSCFSVSFTQRESPFVHQENPRTVCTVEPTPPHSLRMYSNNSLTRCQSTKSGIEKAVPEQPKKIIVMIMIVITVRRRSQGVSALAPRALLLFLPTHNFFPTRVSRCGATVETCWPAAAMVLPTLFLYASTAPSVSKPHARS